MDSNPRQCVRRERRHHCAREALGIGYWSFDVEPPAWTKRKQSAAAPTTQESPNTDPVVAQSFEAEDMSVCRQAVTLSLTSLIFVLSLLVVFVFLVRGYSLLYQFMNYRGGSI